MERDEFKHESLQDTSSIVSYLEAVIEGLRSGSLELSDDEAKVVLEPRGLLALELRAKRKGRRNKFQMKLTWNESKPETKPNALKVTSGAPEEAKPSE